MESIRKGEHVHCHSHASWNKNIKSAFYRWLLVFAGSTPSQKLKGQVRGKCQYEGWVDKPIFFKTICMDWRRCREEGFQNTWLPGVTFTKALAPAMPDDECGLEGYGRAEYLAGCLLFLCSPWKQRHWKKTCREGEVRSCGKWRSRRVSEMCQTNTTCPQL